MWVPFHHKELLNPAQYSLRPELAEFKLLVIKPMPCLYKKIKIIKGQRKKIKALKQTKTKNKKQKGSQGTHISRTTEL